MESANRTGGQPAEPGIHALPIGYATETSARE